MRAMLLRRPDKVERRPLSPTDLPEPEPGRGQIRVRVGACGVCHTDLHEVEGELIVPNLPGVIGHEIVGAVDSLGEGCSRFKLGQRVGIPWLHRTCGRCEFCLSGKENLCENALFTGYDVNGGYAELTIVDEDFAYAIPDRFSDAEAAPLLCAGVIGFRALRLSEIQPGQRLGLFGFGASAHVAIQVAVHWGCEVFVFSRTEEHRRHAEELGAAWTGTSKEKPPALLDSAINFAPSGPLTLDALSVLKKGGSLALASIYMDPIPEMDYDKYLYNERTLRSVTASTRQDAIDILRLADEIPIRTEVETFDLEDANTVLLLMKQSKIKGAGVLVVGGD
ncbi:MAG: zinc-dependent alcohol dehydrogenase family protein [Candidatus Coatesbacteria bacterium]|nr:zinc-dependent alcohol dehydrogenase family protein [Candidatus Coatesbacteria bacterium]